MTNIKVMIRLTVLGDPPVDLRVITLGEPRATIAEEVGKEAERLVWRYLGTSPLQPATIWDADADAEARQP